MNAIIALSLFGIANLFIGLQNKRKLLLPATLLFLILAMGINVLDWNQQYLYFNEMLRVNNLFINFSTIILLSALLVVAISRGFGTDDEHTHPAEYYAIMMFSAVGAMMMVGYENIIMLFVGLEILSVSMYILTGTDKRSLRSNEAALKYFLMGSFATGIFLFGVALIYGATGSFDITNIGNFVLANRLSISPLLYVGIILMLIGMLFKVSAAPFHFWTPDVYDGAPTIFTAYMSTIVKTAGFAALAKLLYTSFSGLYGFWWNTVVVITILTLLIGNLTAVYQQSFKRMLAYSSISHAGYMLISLVALSPASQSSILFYSLSYTVATITAFAVLILVSESKQKDGRPDESIDALNGLAKKSPLLAFALAVSMLSLAGIPLTAGFWGKFFVFSNAIDRRMIFILIYAVLMSAVGIYYYFKPIIAAYMKEGDGQSIEISPLIRFVIIVMVAITIILGIMPDLAKSVF
jgi:NADH-quinone oxidoreductase subunit N